MYKEFMQKYSHYPYIYFPFKVLKNPGVIFEEGGGGLEKLNM